MINLNTHTPYFSKLQKIVTRTILPILLLFIYIRCDHAPFSGPRVIPKTEYQKVQKMLPAAQLKYYIDKYSDQYCVPEVLMYAIVANETGWKGPNHVTYKYDTVSRAGALGAFQIMPIMADTFTKRLGIYTTKKQTRQRVKSDLETNVHVAVAVVSFLSKKYNGDYKKVLMVYNGGPKTLKSSRKYKGVHKYKNKIYSIYTGKRSLNWI